MMGKKGPESGTNAPSANVPAANAAINAPPPPVVMPKPVEPAAGAPAATEAEIKAAKGKATEATKAMAKAIADAEQAGAAQVAGPSLDALKTSEKTIMASFKKAKNPPEFDAVTQASQQVVVQAGQVKTQAEQAKSAAAAEDTRKSQEAEAAKKKADEEAKKKADDTKKAADTTAAQAATKKGDFVESWALDVKPKPDKEIKADYTPMARQNRAQGRVTLEVTVDEGGRATAAQVLKGLSPDYGIHDALVRAALATKFSPGMKDGQPVKTKYIVNLNYTMK
jgi:TonB family protein